MKLSAIIWDWNGTLLDDVDYAIGCMNRLLTARSMPRLDRARYRSIFTFPVKTYYQRLGFKIDREPFEALSREFINHYYRNLEKPDLHAGARELLVELADLGLVQCVLSAMENGPLLRQISRHDISPNLNAIQGLDHINANSKTAEGELLLRQLQMDRRHILFVGDTYHDLEVGRHLGLRVALLTHGHQDIKSPQTADVPTCGNIYLLRELLRTEFGVSLKAGPTTTR
ncbi:MAG: HAD hydrolase-like protein [Candidatus Neomarinimicrobiota bacterium]